MLKVLVLCAALLSLAVPSAAQIDPQSLVGVWDGSWTMRTPERQVTGQSTITISKVENGKVYGKTESMGSRENPVTNWIADVTPDGFAFVSPQGIAVKGVLDGKTLRIQSGRGGIVTSILTKK